MRHAIIGGTGMLGQALAQRLRQAGDDVIILTRSEPSKPEHSQWSATKGLFDPERLSGLDTVFNVTGASIATRPWTTHRRGLLRSSRIDSTEALLTAFSKLQAPPKTWVGAGGLGIYGDRGDTPLTEEDPPGEGFLAELSVDWETIQLAASERLGSRAVSLRMSIILAREGGAFPLMLFPFRYGMGGWLGDGKQYTPWISLRDAARAFEFAARTPDMSGAYNLCAPNPPRNRAWCKALGQALGRPVLTGAPKWALRGALGELADNLFLASVNTEPGRILEAGFTFEDPDALGAFQRLTAKS